MDLPETLRRRLDDFSRNVLFEPNRNQPPAKDRDATLHRDRRVLSSLPLQMSLFFNACFFPCWWVSETAMLQLKYAALPDYYRFILVTVLLLMTAIESIRLYLGFTGNLQEKVPELAGFWLLSLLLQLPLLLFQLLNESILVQPLERGVHLVQVAFLLSQALAGFVALRDMVRSTQDQFQLQQFH